MKGFDLSRFAGLWVGMKAIADTMDASATVRSTCNRYRTVSAGRRAALRGGRNARLHLTPPQQEEMHRHFRLPAAMAFARANGFDRIAMDAPKPRYGIAASGKAYLHVRQALRDLGIGDELAAALGIRVYKIGLVWPLDGRARAPSRTALRRCSWSRSGATSIEHQLRAAAYGLADGRRPRILGKRDAAGAPLISDLIDIGTADVARAILATMPGGVEDARDARGRSPSGAGREGRRGLRSAACAHALFSARAARTAHRPACRKEAAPWPASAVTFSRPI